MAAKGATPPSLPPTASTTAETEAKTVLGKYHLGRVLGRGSFAKVYHARSIKDDKSVAIKVIDKSKTDPSIYPRIVGEVAAMRRLDHPNVLRIYEVMASKNKIYLVMELAKGGDLFGKLSRRPDHRFTEPLARKFFHQLVSALDYCHRNGVAHRDIKPQNILLDEEGNIKVCDFGLSALTADSPTQARVEARLLQTACGTPAFAAPEVVGRSGAGYDGNKADAWSCGVILYVLLTGYLPFDDGNLVIMYRKMHKREFRFPSWISKPARGLITGLLDPNPNTRLSIAEIKKDTWFKNQGLVYPRSVSLGDLASLEENKIEKRTERTSMNAFEIISMSSGLDLSGLLDEFNGQLHIDKRFISKECKGVVIDKVVEVGTKLGYEVERRENVDGCVWLGRGRFVFSVTVTEVAAGVVVGEVKVVDGGGVGWDQEELLWGEFKNGLDDIVLSWHNDKVSPKCD